MDWVGEFARATAPTRRQIHSPAKHGELEAQVRAGGGLVTPLEFNTKRPHNTKYAECASTLKRHRGVTFQVQGDRVRIVYSSHNATVKVVMAGRVALVTVQANYRYNGNAEQYSGVVSIGVKRHRHCYAVLSHGLAEVSTRAPDGKAYVRESRRQRGVFLVHSRTEGHPGRAFVCCQCNAGFRTFVDFGEHVGISRKDLAAYW